MKTSMHEVNDLTIDFIMAFSREEATKGTSMDLEHVPSISKLIRDVPLNRNSVTLASLTRGCTECNINQHGTYVHWRLPARPSLSLSLRDL